MFQSYYERNQLRGYNSGQIAWIGSLQLWGVSTVTPVVAQLTISEVYFFGIVAGVLMDRRGARLPVAIGSVLFLAGTFLTSLCARYWHFLLAQGVCSALGLGMLMVPALSGPAQYL